jgi:predicted nucleotide-binding protein
LPYHVYIASSGSRAGRSITFNVTDDWIRERIVEPWERGDDIVIGGRQWTLRGVHVRIYEGDEVVGSGLDAWNAMVRAATDKTDDFLRRAAGSSARVGRDDFAEDRRAVMVVYGRNGRARQAMFDFLRAVDLRPMEWTELVGAANIGAPYIGEVLDGAFARAQAAVILSTPDDLARLRSEFIPEGDPDREAEVRGQARPNVFFEAGMAMGRFPRRTILTELGQLRPASDVAGRHAVRLNEGPECRRDLAQRLENAGCTTNTTGTDWLSAGNFSPVASDNPMDGFGGLLVNPLIPRIDALLADLQGQDGYVAWRVAEVYNELVRQAGVPGIPRADRQTSSTLAAAAGVSGRPASRSKMDAQEMRTLLNQVRAQL